MTDLSPTDFRALCAELVVIEDAMSGGSVQLSSQGQALDGYAALAAFRYIAAKARIALAQPEPQVPTNEELHQLWLELYAFHDGPTSGDVAEIARAVLARYGRPAITPIPVSERLPEPEDTTDRNECWYWHPGEKCWEMVPVVTYGIDEWTHWLPHHALPVPQQEAQR